MNKRDRVKQHAAAIQQLETAEADVKRAEETLANLQGTLENRRKAVAQFEAGGDAPVNLVGDPSPAGHMTTKATTSPAKFNELPGRESLVPPAKP